MDQGQICRKLDSGVNQRIAQQETYRNSLQRYRDSDKAFFLDIVRSLVSVLLFMCIAGMVLIFGSLEVMPPFLSNVISLSALGIAITAAIATMQLGTYDSSKISALIRKIDVEIEALKEARRKLQKAHDIVD